MKEIPRIKEVNPLKDMLLLVTFDNHIKKQYDVKQLIPRFPVFKSLKNNALFNMVKVDTGGFGIIWNDEIDLSEYELWQNGKTIN